MWRMEETFRMRFYSPAAMISSLHSVSLAGDGVFIVGCVCFITLWVDGDLEAHVSEDVHGQGHVVKLEVRGRKVSNVQKLPG